MVWQRLSWALSFELRILFYRFVFAVEMEMTIFGIVIFHSFRHIIYGVKKSQMEVLFEKYISDLFKKNLSLQFR